MRLLCRPQLWLAAFLLWFAVLWALSSFSQTGQILPPIPHFDKVEHFVYFFSGGIVLSAYLFRLRSGQPNWKWLIPAVILAGALVGWLDEWHQTFTPGRSGNDPYDWLADFLGSAAGAFVFQKIHRLLK